MNDANMSHACSIAVPDRRPARRRLRGALALSAITLVALSLASRVNAIQFYPDYDEIARPAFDPDGTELRRIATAAAIIWEDYILDDRSFFYDLSWDNIDRFAEFHFYPGFSKKIIVDTHDDAGQPLNWYFDPTPLVNEEYDMYQTLYGASQSEPGFAGTPPDLLETGWEGGARGPNGVASGKLDLLTTVLHEMGHYLGINLDLADSAFNINPATLGGANVSVFATDEPFYEAEHLEVSTALMAADQGRGVRRLPSATDILATWDESQFSQFDVPRVDFIGAQSTEWEGTLNWIGGRVPDWDNQVFVRHGGQVRLTSGFSEAASLTVEAYSSAAVADNNFLRVYGPVVVGGEPAQEGEPTPLPGQVHIGGLSAGFPELEANSVQINLGYVNLQSPSSVLTVNGTLRIEPVGRLLGAGNVFARGQLENEGEISGGTFLGGGELILRTAFGGRLDLDGVSEQGRISTAYGNLRVDGTQHEPFSGVASITPGRKITFMQSFAIDGSLVFTGDPLNSASVSGTELWLRGRIDVTGNAVIEAPLMVFNNPAQETTVHAGGKLNLLPGRMGIGSSPDVYRGRIMLEQNAYLLLNVGLASSWELAGSLNMTNATVTGDSIINTGHLRGSGTLYVGKLENSGTVDVGDSIGVLNIGEGGRYVQTASGTLGIEASGFRPGTRYDQLKVTLGATLDGKLSVDFINGYLPAAGVRFDVLLASSISGQFAELELRAPEGRFVEGQLLYGADRVTLEILASGFTADFDMDGDVDGADLLRWKEGFGRAHRREQGDADGDLDVDGADFLAWQQQLGSVSPVPTAAAVPEPGAYLLFILASAGFRRTAGRKC
ncbi:MAG: hypothetical protein H0T51_22080 [Pirellulales bacterium]|nr:hypothetical protein [Pirellulales bacterium]